MALEQKFVSYLLDQIDSEMEGVGEPARERINVHLTQLRGIADEVFGGSQPSSSRGRRGGGTNA